MTLQDQVSRTIGVAIAVPEPFGGQLQRDRRRFGDVMADAIPTHVTLLPPTPVVDDLLPGVEEHLVEAADQAAPFVIRLRGTATFRPVSSVVYVNLLQGISECEKLAAAVRAGPLEQPLAFPYHPHVTVAHDLPDDVLDRASQSLDGFECTFTVDAFDLFEHHRDAGWRRRRRFLLG